MKFVHLADCHLGAWRQPELNKLNFLHFQKVIDTCIKEKVNFVLIAGDLFDSSYPSIDTLKEAFKEFRKLKESSIPVFIIAGSHDYSVSGKSFLEVLEKAGFCTNVSKYEEKNDKIILEPTIYESCAIYGYPGKKSGMDIEEIEKIKLEDSPGMFKILMLHTTLRSAVPNPNIKAVDDTKLPKVDYIALGHLHVNYSRGNKVYAGPTFPNNLSELEELKGGSYYLFNNGRIQRRELKLKEVIVIEYSTNNTLNATEKILHLLAEQSLKDKIVILKVSGVLETGKTFDIDFKKLENCAKDKGAFSFLRNTSRLHIPESELKLDTIGTEDMEVQIIKNFEKSNPSRFNGLINVLIRTLQIEKLEDERSSIFEERLLSEAKKIIQI